MILKQGDLAPSLVIDINASVVGASSLKAKLRQFHTGTVVEKTLTATDAEAGIMTYAWQPGDTDTPGTYEVEAVVTFAGGEVQTFPQRSDLELVILPKVIPPTP